MAQYDVHENLSEFSSRRIPYLLDVQSRAFDRSAYRLAVPLVPIDAFPGERTRLNPLFEIAGREYALLPLDLASLPLAVFGEVRAGLSGESDRILGALDLVLARI